MFYNGSVMLSRVAGSVRKPLGCEGKFEARLCLLSITSNYRTVAGLKGRTERLIAAPPIKEIAFHFGGCAALLMGEAEDCLNSKAYSVSRLLLYLRFTTKANIL